MPTISMFYGILISIFFADDLHREELLADWELVRTGEQPFRIAPLQ